MSEYYIGVDLGGTNIAAGIVDKNGEIICKKSVRTNLPKPEAELENDIFLLCKSLCEENGYDINKDIICVGIGTPGSVDGKRGIVWSNVNFGYENWKIKENLEKLFGLSVYVENDANAAAFGEYVVNGKGAKNVIFVTLGTGIGGGIIINGKLYKGANGAAGELGHCVLVEGGLPCTCGMNGCWEQYASVTALISQTKAAIEKNPDSLMVKISEERGVVNGRTAFEAAKKGDKAAEEVVSQYAQYIAAGTVSMINIFQPEKLIIGGGISREGDYLLNPVREFCNAKSYKTDGKKTIIEAATLFNDAGIIGAALSAR